MTQMPASVSARMVSKAAEQPLSWRAPFFWICMWLAGVALATGLCSSLVLFLKSSGTPQQAQIDGWLWGSRARKLAELQRTFNGTRPHIINPRKAEIEAFLKEITTPTQDDAVENWRKALDVDRFRNRFLNSPWVQSMSLIDQHEVKSAQIEELSIEGPDLFHKIEIIHIVPWAEVGGKSARTDETLVFTLAHRGYRDCEQVLFWLRETEGRWKLVDWEIVDGGLSESESAGLWKYVSHDKLYPSCKRGHEYLLQADALPYRDEDEYENLLRLAEGCSVPVPVADLTRYKILNRWSGRSRHDEVIRFVKQVRDPERIPGILVVHATACESLGETVDALNIIDQLEHSIGFRTDISEMRAKLLKQANRLDEAVTEWQRLAKFEPDRVTHLTELYKLLPKSKRVKVIDQIKARHHPATVALQFAWQNSDRMATDTLRDLSEFVKKVAPESTEARELEILLLKKDFQYRAAATIYREAAERETDPDTRQYLWGSYLQEMNLAGELLAGFVALPDQRAALRRLVNGSDDDDLDWTTSTDDLIPLFAAYREKQPNDPWLLYFEGYVALEQQRYADADKSFAESERLVSEKMEAAKQSENTTPANPPEDEKPDPDDLEELIALTRHHRCRALYELGNDVDVLVIYRHHQAAYQTLAGLAMQYGHWPVLERLNRAYGSVNPTDEWVLFYDAHALLAMKDFAAVRAKLRVMIRREDAKPNLKYWREQLEQELFAADHPDPMEAYLHSEDRKSAFKEVSRKLLVHRDWTSLEKLCEQQSTSGHDPEVSLTQLEMAWRRSEDVRVVDLLTPWPTSTIARRSYLASAWRERLVESLLRLQRWDEARARALEVKQRFDEPWPLIMTYIASKNAAALSQWLSDDESLPEPWVNKDFAADSQLRPVLIDDAFANLRQQRQFRIPDYRSGESLVLLLRDPMELSESWLRERLTDPETPPESTPNISQLSPATFVIHWKGMRFAATTVAEPYFKPEFVQSRAFTNRPHDGMEALFDRQCAYLKLSALIADDPQPWDSPSTTVRELGSRLLNADVVGAAYRPALSYQDQVVLLNDGQSDLLASRLPFTRFDVSMTLRRSDQKSSRLSADKRQSLETLAEQPQPLDYSVQVDVEIQLCDPDLPMTVPFHVHQVRHGRYRGYELVVEYMGKDHSPGFPELRNGVQYIVPLEHVVNVTVSGP